MDELIDQFEQRCEVGEFEDIRSCLNNVSRSGQSVLFVELLKIEIFYRQKLDQKETESHFRKKYPEFSAQIKEVFDSQFKSPIAYESASEIGKTRSIDPGAGQKHRQVDRYKLLQEIGQGGMGTVWMAEQTEPIRRRVALKLIRTDGASAEVATRFEAERQALSMMNHQNIAKVFDAGTTDAHEPFFVMELVSGVPLTEYCDQNKLSIRERLKLFVPVCGAVQHAHQKGIIHRDLKPSNVLVGIYDGKPVPKVIDFGLAKALEHTTKLTNKTLFTEFGKVVGTLQYMAPEQAEVNSLDVDTRTDVYSLGVMLYELMTGSTPLERELVGDKKLLQILQMIRDTDPPLPSARLASKESTSKESTSKFYDHRNVTPAKLNSILKGELDWVIMKALEKDRTRRYDSAGNVADEIQRFLDGDAVEARPPTAG